MSENCKRLEDWIATDENVTAAIAYGSRRSDYDYMIFFRAGKVEFDPGKLFVGATWNGGNHGCSIVAGEDLFDLCFTSLPLEFKRTRQLGEMLRNSEPVPSWLKGKENPELKELLDYPTKFPDRARLSEKEILDTVRSIYIQTRFLVPKIMHGPRHGRYLVANTLEPGLWALAREVDLRRGGKGKYKLRDAELSFSPAELEMLTVNYSLDVNELAEALVRVRTQVRYWLAMLNIPCPDYLCKPW